MSSVTLAPCSPSRGGVLPPSSERCCSPLILPDPHPKTPGGAQDSQSSSWDLFLSTSARVGSALPKGGGASPFCCVHPWLNPDLDKTLGGSERWPGVSWQLPSPKNPSLGSAPRPSSLPPRCVCALGAGTQSRVRPFVPPETILPPSGWLQVRKFPVFSPFFLQRLHVHSLQVEDPLPWRAVGAAGRSSWRGTRRGCEGQRTCYGS